MSIDMSKIKNHPGFMPFGSRNVSSDISDTQSEKDKTQTAEEIRNDARLEDSNAGGEQGRA
jgi:hypothetical protein